MFCLDNHHLNLPGCICMYLAANLSQVHLQTLRFVSEPFCVLLCCINEMSKGTEVGTQPYSAGIYSMSDKKLMFQFLCLIFLFCGKQVGREQIFQYFCSELNPMEPIWHAYIYYPANFNATVPKQCFRDLE